VEDLNVVSDKRRYKRVDSKLPIEYRDLRRSAVLPKGSLTRNISEGGICFQSSEFMSLACRLVVEIRLPNVPKPIKAISKIAWVKRLPTSDQYELGNQFLEIAKEDKTHILNFINRVVENRPLEIPK
jgi:c-di-GMP-binding flagellar brake protein YcgR